MHERLVLEEKVKLCPAGSIVCLLHAARTWTILNSRYQHRASKLLWAACAALSTCQSLWSYMLTHGLVCADAGSFLQAHCFITAHTTCESHSIPAAQP